MTVDVSATPRGSMSPMQRLRIWEAHKGVCCLCKQKIDGVREKWIVEHPIPLALGGPDTDENKAPAHESCRRLKDKDDLPRISKAKRMKAKHIGIKRSSTFPCSRDSGWKKRMDGTVVRRST